MVRSLVLCCVLLALASCAAAQTCQFNINGFSYDISGANSMGTLTATSGPNSYYFGLCSANVAIPALFPGTGCTPGTEVCQFTGAGNAVPYYSAGAANQQSSLQGAIQPGQGFQILYQGGASDRGCTVASQNQRWSYLSLMCAPTITAMPFVVSVVEGTPCIYTFTVQHASFCGRSSVPVSPHPGPSPYPPGPAPYPTVSTVYNVTVQAQFVTGTSMCYGDLNPGCTTGVAYYSCVGPTQPQCIVASATLSFPNPLPQEAQLVGLNMTWIFGAVYTDNTPSSGNAAFNVYLNTGFAGVLRTPYSVGCPYQPQFAFNNPNFYNYGANNTLVLNYNAGDTSSNLVNARLCLIDLALTLFYSI